MITVEEIKWIRETKREFKARFGHDLELDLLKMGRKRRTPDKLSTEVNMLRSLNYWVEYYGASLEKIRSHIRFHSHSMVAEYAAVKAFAVDVYDNNWNKRVAAGLINRERTIFYHLKDNP